MRHELAIQYFPIANLLSSSSDTPTKQKSKKSKAKTQRKWGDEAPTESDMASLDFSYVDVPSPNAPVKGPDVTALVDRASLGTVKDGIYEVKDWEFASTSELSASMLTKALQPEKDEKSASYSLFGNVFARLTGSKVLTEEDLKPVLEAMKQHLMKKNVAKEIADKVCDGVSDSLVGKKVGSFQCGSFSVY